MSVLKQHYVVDGSDLTLAGAASGSVKSALRRLGYSPEATRKIAIAMYEAEINTVIHASGGEIDVFIYPDRVEFIVKDQGPGIPDVERAMQEGWSTASENIREQGFGAGMGLPNIKKYSDSMKIESTPGVGTTLYITVNNVV
jgi:anti-sigma regulatory factor (Ser/Thr protein kinase)